MKKNGFSRLLAMLLVLAMVLPMVPMSAFAAVGDVVDGDMSLPTGGTGVSDTDTVSWPVKIYDYLNDGMLFEYAQAHDLTASENLSYGGGMPMPFTSGVIGNDYTAAWAYNKRAWGFWSGDAKAVVTTYDAVDDISPRYMRVTFQAVEGEGGHINTTLSDFLSDNSARQDKDDIRYFVIVYRTGGGYTDSTYHLNWMVGGEYTSTGGGLDTGTRYFSNETDKLPASKDENTWTYYVVDMKTDYSSDSYTGIAEGWDAIGADSVTGVRSMLPLDATGEYMDISHIAYFSSAEEAGNFGEKALVFNNDPGVYIGQKTIGGTDAPVAGDGYVYDYTTQEAYESKAYSSWYGTSGNNWYGGGLGTSWLSSTKVSATGSSPMYLRVKETGDSSYDTGYIADLSGDFGSVKKEDMQYVVLVYRSSGITNGTSMGFWLMGDKVRVGSGGRSYAVYTFTASSGWTYAVYNLGGALALADSDWSKNTYIYQVGMYFPGFTSSSQYIDISHIGFFGSQAEADTFGKAAVAFDMNPGEIIKAKTWNMGNNSAFAMLYSSAGGAWEKGTGTGGDSTASNGYFTYPIGLLQTPTDAWGTTTQNAMISNHETGVGSTENQIYLLYPDHPDGTEYDNESDFKMSTLNFDGYTLFGDVIQNGTTLFTAGLIEPTLETVTYADGTTSRRIVYREETVDYIAKLLYNTLLIPRFDANGNPNYNYVRGTAHTQFGTVNGEAIDLATALRNCLGITFTDGADKGTATAAMGTYAQTEAKKANLIGAFKTCEKNITTFYDAAYYLLNNLFVKNSYNEEQDDYAYLQLNKVEGTEDTYVFDAGFTTSNDTSAVDYGNDQILNMVGAAGKDLFYFETSSKTTLYPFLPVTDANNNSSYPDMTWTPYFADDGVASVTNGKDSYNSRNFNYVMATNGEFQYYSDDALFFEFEGDDDVYLFLNGQLVLDIGGGHSIAKATFKVDDYVNWAWNIKNDAAQYAALSASEKARVDALALNDGDSCDFDFYYMERHGFGANCRIMTNIRVTDPAMNVTKSAYQEGVEVAEGGIISKDKPVEYGFAMTNLTDVELFRLSFVDETIGIELSYDNGLKVTGSNVCDVNGGTLEVTDLVAYVDGYDASGNKYDTITVTFANEEQLKKFLMNLTDPGSAGLMESGGGLWMNSTVTIRGFAYKLTEEQKTAGRFDNLVKGTAYTDNDIPVKSEDEMRVFIAAEPMYYQWAGEDHGLNVTLDKLINDIKAAANTTGNSLAGQGLNEITPNNVTAIAEVNAAGSVRDYPHVVVNADKSLTISYDASGSYVFYLKITYNGKNATIPVLVNVADVVDSIFVLDYGLNAELTKNGELYKEDTLTVPARASTHTLLSLGDNTVTPSYGSNNISFTGNVGNTIGDSTVDNGTTGYDGIFTMTSKTLSYKPNDFMNQRDKIWLALSVHEDETGFASKLGETNINKEAQMYKSVTVLPANVVYYEDDFPAITYSNIVESGSVEEVTGTFTVINGSSADLNQDVDQDQEYGQDSNYQSNSHDMSGNSLHAITVRDANTFASFAFTGTGFELIGSTVANNPASLVVTVLDANNETVKRIPVITEYDNGDNGGDEVIYQVPVIRVEDLDYGPYTVSINGVPTYDRTFNESGTAVLTMKDSYFYLDGLRIFEPLAKTEEDGTVNPGAADEYREEESDVQFVEIREEILNGKVATATVTSGTTEDNTVVTVNSALSTWTENHHGDSYDENGKQITTTYEGNAVSSVEDYLIKGPNNEVYMNGDLAETALIFYVKETSADVKHDLQIAVHAIDAAKFYIGSTDVYSGAGFKTVVQYGTYDATTKKFDWAALATVESATEQYYTIPYAKGYYSEDLGAYQVAVYVDSGMASFTSLKMNGLELVTIADPDDTDETINSTVLYYKDAVLYHAGADGVVGNEDDVLASEYTAPALEAVGFQMRRMSLVVEDVPEETTPTEPEETTEPSEPEETTEPSEPETEPTKPDKDEKPGNTNKPGNDNNSGSNKPGNGGNNGGNNGNNGNNGNSKPGSSSNADKLTNLWKSLWESVEYLLQLVGRK